jgi:transcriptional regulator with XRE-family HTH domain
LVSWELVQASSRRIYRVLGEAVRAKRKKARLSQEQLAETAGLTRNYIGDIERAEKKITIETLARLAKALKCRVRDLTWDM